VEKLMDGCYILLPTTGRTVLNNIRSLIQVFLLLTAICAAIVYIPSRSIDAGQPAKPFPFDEKRAMEFAASLARQYPSRPFGSESAHAAAAWIGEQLKAAGLQVENMEFESETGEPGLRGINVAATLTGAAGPPVWVLASYDSAIEYPTGKDRASSIGILIELARQMATQKLNRAHRFIAVDGSEWGMLGVKRLAQGAGDALSGPGVILVIDSLANEEGKFLSLDSDGFSGGYAPAWLRRISLRNLQDLGIHARHSFGFWEHTQRALDMSWRAQGYFLAKGLPAIGLRNVRITDDEQQALLPSSASDMNPAGAASCGLAASGLLATIESLEVLPQGDGAQFNLYGSYWVNPIWLKWAHWICFLPLALAAFHAWHSTRVRLASESAEPEWFSVTACVLPLLVGYGVLYLFKTLGQLHASESIPASSQYSSAVSVEWIPLSIAFLAAILTLVFVRFVRREREVPHAGNLLATRTTGIICLALTAFCALLFNSYWAFTFLLMPALLWPLLPEGSRISRGPSETRGAWIIVPISWLPIAAFCIIVAVRIGFDWNAPWYLLLISVSGIIHPVTVVLSIVLLGISWRMMLVYLTANR
jgi:hypothetical protein